VAKAGLAWLIALAALLPAATPAVFSAHAAGEAAAPARAAGIRHGERVDPARRGPPTPIAPLVGAANVQRKPG